MPIAITSDADGRASPATHIRVVIPQQEVPMMPGAA
jgi:hypothetical protein